MNTNLFNRNDIQKVAESKKQSNLVMQRIDHYLVGIKKTITIKAMRRSGIVDVTAPLKHYDLDKCIKFFKSIEHKDARRHAKKARKTVIKLLEAVKEDKDQQCVILAG